MRFSIYLLLFVTLSCATACSSRDSGSGLLPGDGSGDSFLTEPPVGAVFPSDLAPPIFQWPGPEKGPWRLEIRAETVPEPLFLTARANPWVPTEKDWEAIRNFAPEQPLSMKVTEEVDGGGGAFRTEFTISGDPLDCQIFYLDIPVPFPLAEKDVTQFRWCSYVPQRPVQPSVVLEKLPYCANCHTFSDNGQLFGLDMDYRGDKGGFVLAEVAPRIGIRRENVISWNDMDRQAKNPSRGLFARISPDGGHVLATVKERPFLIRINDPAYSQLFFPLTGRIAVYDVGLRSFSFLPGADDPDIIQTNPVWSHDGRTVAFARGQASQDLWDALGKKKVLDAAPGEDIFSLNRKHRMQFDLWHVPFGQGDGGIASPIQGASGNGLSNYFPRYSPDGRWMVFCRAETGLVSQPGSRLAIIPAGGGSAREMRCNRPQLNSWHSFSPNGKWMVFSSKENGGTLTRAYLTHIDAQGMDSPAILLHRIGSPGRAAILPEMVRLPGKGTISMELVEP